MKRSLAFLALFILLAACAPDTSGVPDMSIPSGTATNTFVPRPTSTPAATLIPCPPEGVPIVIDDIEIYFDNGVPGNECNLFALYTQKFNTWMNQNGYRTGQIRVSVFSDDDRVTDFEYEWANQHDCNPDSKEAILALWNRNASTQAQSTYGASFYQVFSGNWPHVDLNEKLVAIIGEQVNVAHLNYTGSCQRFWLIPDWFQDSGHYLARQMERLWGIEPVDWTDWRNSNPECKTIPLAQTQAGQPCVYLEGEQALVLLAHLYGEKSFQVFELVGNGRSFSGAFREVYSISESEFYKVYDEFRASGYKLPNSAITSTP